MLCSWLFVAGIVHFLLTLCLVWVRTACLPLTLLYGLVITRIELSPLDIYSGYDCCQNSLSHFNIIIWIRYCQNSSSPLDFIVWICHRTVCLPLTLRSGFVSVRIACIPWHYNLDLSLSAKTLCPPDIMIRICHRQNSSSPLDIIWCHCQNSPCMYLTF